VAINFSKLGINPILANSSKNRRKGHVSENLNKWLKIKGFRRYDFTNPNIKAWQTEILAAQPTKLNSPNRKKA
jgi:hypothetical protein